MAGFTKPTTTQTPDALFDYWLTRLTGGELRVLLYAIRRTFGFHKDDDDISIQQFMHGIITVDGKVLDEGTGLSRQSVITATEKLSAKGLLVKTRQRLGDNRDAVNNYRLVIGDPRNPRAETGYRAVNTTQVPDELFDYWLPRHSDAELFVLLYIVRRTLGFSKPSDIITEKQFLCGVRRRDGTPLDEGCGVSRNTLYSVLKGLQDKGLISIQRRMSPTLGKVAPVYSLVFESDRPAVIAAPDPRHGDTVEEVDAAPRPLAGAEGAYRREYGGQEAGTWGASSRDVGVKGAEQGSQLPVMSQSRHGDKGGNSAGRGGQDSGTGGSSREERGYTQRLDPQQTGYVEEQETDHQQRRQQDRGISKSSSGTGADDKAGHGTHAESRERGGGGPRIFSAYIDTIIRDLTHEFHDGDSLHSNRRRAYNLWRASGLSEADFANLLYIAREITRERAVEKRAASGPPGQRNRMPYFFTVVERELVEAGIVDPASDGQGQGAEPEPAGDDCAVSEAQVIWQAVLDELRMVLTAENYDAWLSPTHVVSLDGDRLEIGVPTAFHRDWLRGKLGPRIESTLQRLDYGGLRVEYSVAPGGALC